MKGYQTGATMTTACVTLCFAVFLLSAVVTADFVTKNEGENLTISCSTDESFSGLYLDVRRPEKYEIFYYDSNSKHLTYTPEYKERVTIKGDFKNLTVTLNELNLKDSGAYTCRYSSLMDSAHENGASLLFVKAKDVVVPVKDEPPSNPDMLMIVSIVTACTVFFLIVVLIGVWAVPKVKHLCAKQREESSRPYNPVYEDMRAHRQQNVIKDF